MSTHDDSPSIARRSLFAGAGAAALAGAALVGAPRAEADTRRPLSTDKQSLGVPAGVNPIGSAPISGYTYIHKTMWDFSPEHYSSGRAWSPTGGVYVPLGSGDNLWTVVDLPAGAYLHDVEWYLSATENAQMMGRLWVAGDAYLSAIVADGTIAAGTAGTRAQRIAPPAATNGPFPFGTSLVLGVWTPNTGTVSINGVRVGFTRGAGRTGVLAQPVRAYDSRKSGGKLSAGKARKITLPASLVPPGVSAVIVNITALGATKSGSLKVYQGNQAQPAGSVLSFASTGKSIANEVTVGVSNARQLKLLATQKTHVVVDVIGTVG
jgi:hypothetical protein